MKEWNYWIIWFAWLAGFGVLYTFADLYCDQINGTYFIEFLFGSEDGRLSCGYSSFRGKRVTMEDFYDIKTLKIGGQSICLFGIFDGKIFYYITCMGEI